MADDFSIIPVFRNLKVTKQFWLNIQIIHVKSNI